LWIRPSLQQLAPGGRQVILARLELAGRNLDEVAPERIAVLALEHHPAIVEQRDDRHRAGVADVLAHRFAAVGQPHAVAVHLEQAPGEHFLAREQRLGQILRH
jgi:hypothetical protein